MAYVAVAVGGFLGACLRFLLTEWLGTIHGFPAATLLINLLGSFFLAWFYTLTAEKLPVHPHLRLGIGTGFVGAFTTFSTLSLELWKLYQSGEVWMALLYLLISAGGGILAALAGYWLAGRQSRLSLTAANIQEEV
ncbi:MAG: hypothetical protein A2201_09705 [Alicyclobacillus sp. RIFOXYA1_FULL_53_8]|nr:MAG: hypothetical protein A2201_09705 [Alicyclobacillus sp. RIFOXYA1_FULL_53_8]